MYVLADVVPGPFELHSLSQPCQYPSCIINLRLPADQLLRHMQCSPEWQQVPVLTDADITARATRLGLLPPNTLAAQGVCICVYMCACSGRCCEGCIQDHSSA